MQVGKESRGRRGGDEEKKDEEEKDDEISEASGSGEREDKDCRSQSTIPGSSSSTQEHQPPQKKPSQPQVLAHVVLVRHPQTLANASHLLQGGQTDSPLSQLGEEQLKACDDYVSTWRWGGLNAEGVDEIATTLQMPELIVSSPMGRTMKLAEAIRSSVAAEMDRRHKAPLKPSTPPPSASSEERQEPQRRRPELLPAHSLRERCFGPQECTRKGVHAGPSFPRAPPDAKAESKAAFAERVRSTAIMWFRRAHALGEERWTQAQARVVAGGLESLSSPAVFEPPTVLLVTHGLFISTLFKVISIHPAPLPEASASVSTVSRFKADSFVPFASNTGMYVIQIVALPPSPLPPPPPSSLSSTETKLSHQLPPAPPQRPRLHLLAANHAPHLSSSSSSSSSAAKSSSPTTKRRGEQGGDTGKRQRTLKSFFASQNTSSPSNGSTS